MRKLVLAAVAAAVPLAFSANAFAANSVKYSLKIVPNQKSASTSKLRTVSINPVLNYVSTDSSKIVDPLQFTDLVMPKGFTFNTRGKQTCKESVLAAQQCGRKGLLGAGGASFIAAAGGQSIPASTVRITKGGVPNNKGILVYLSGPSKFFILSNAETPVQDQRTFPGQLIKGSSPIIRIPVYKIVVATLTVSVTKFDAPIGGIFKASTTCPRGGWKSTAKTKFRKPGGDNNPGAQFVNATATVACR